MNDTLELRLQQLQQVNQRIAAHLAQQKAPAMDGVNCRYRAVDGNRCAVGCLIDDQAYAPSMEGAGANETVIMQAVRGSLERLGLTAAALPGWDHRLSTLLRTWQEYHDRLEGYARWCAGADDATSPQDCADRLSAQLDLPQPTPVNEVPQP